MVVLINNLKHQLGKNKINKKSQLLLTANKKETSNKCFGMTTLEDCLLVKLIADGIFQYNITIAIWLALLGFAEISSLKLLDSWSSYE